MSKIKALLFLVIGWALITGCSKKEKACELDPKILSLDIDFSFERLETQFFEAQSIEDFLFLFERYPEFAKDYLLMDSYPDKESLAAELLEANQDELLQELYSEVMSHFSNLDGLETEIRQAFQYIRYYFPEFKIPKVYTFVSGFASDFYLDEEMIVIGLDYYLPFEHRFQPPDLPAYITKRYQKDYIVPTLVTAISERFNKTDLKQNSLLAEMIFYGKAYHFTKAILPCTSDSYIIGYTDEEVAASFDNEVYIWSYFVENELFFETNPFEIRKYTGEAPSTDEISPDAPGRLGRWLGWNIVDDYRSNNELSLDEFMSEYDVDKIFRQSGYKPRP